MAENKPSRQNITLIADQHLGKKKEIAMHIIQDQTEGTREENNLTN